jgi:hypothetical protein
MTKKQRSSKPRQREVSALLRVFDALGSKAPALGVLSRLAEVSTSREYRDVATEALADSRLVAAVDWRSPPDEILTDLRTVIPTKHRKKVLGPLSEDLSAEDALEVVAGRLERAAGPRLAYIDQSSDTYIVFRVSEDHSNLADTIKEAGLGRLKLFPLRTEAQEPKVRRATKPRTSSGRVSTPVGQQPKTWRGLLDHLGVTTDRGVLLHVVLNSPSRATVAAFVEKAPKPVRPTLAALLSLLSGEEPDSADPAGVVDAIGYWASVPGTQSACIDRLLDIARRPTSARLLTAILWALKFSVHPDPARAHVRQLSAADRETLHLLLARGFVSRDPTTLAAAATAAGGLALREFEPRLRDLMRSGPPLAQGAAKDALAAIRTRG